MHYHYKSVTPDTETKRLGKHKTELVNSFSKYYFYWHIIFLKAGWYWDFSFFVFSKLDILVLDVSSSVLLLNQSFNFLPNVPPVSISNHVQLGSQWFTKLKKTFVNEKKKENGRNQGRLLLRLMLLSISLAVACIIRLYSQRQIDILHYLPKLLKI